ncbi:hypothetical protein [Mesorhizobium sp. BE184]|uniref:hypothetical protein n=1 Tax=Mesorhizobium sp. BE184 TaxID=2817714 RepID=UPI0028603DDA|nr:hypothetical protein [Mesorhizobium sp. BE184]MDR7032929.1 hypothetical protein [Mesorhizobium sp. BE184]
MARSVSASTLALLQQRALVARDFLWIVARDRDTGAPVTDGMWSDVGTITASVIDPDTGMESSRTWQGSGTLVAISDIPLVSNLTVQNVTIQLSQVDDRVAELVRLYDCKQARVEIYRGLFDPETRLMTAPAVCRFVGFVDQIEISTPKEGDEGAVTMTCASHTQEMTRANPDTRSDASQRKRNPVDTFYADTATVSDWEVFWGSQKGKMPTQPKKKKFLGIF